VKTATAFSSEKAVSGRACGVAGNLFPGTLKMGAALTVFGGLAKTGSPVSA
jgi:hypothetical protein